MVKLLIQYKKQISFGLTAAVLLLSLIGSFQYYSEYMQAVPERFLSAILYSTIQLYLFSPTAGPGEATPLCYEIAKWAAPLCTTFWLFNALEAFFRHRFGLLKLRFGKQKQTIIFGYNEISSIFIQNLIRRNQEHPNSRRDPRQLLLVTEKSIEKEEALALERDGVIILQTDFLINEKHLVAKQLQKLITKSLSEIALFYDDATWNFTLLTELLDCITENGFSANSQNGKFFCAVRCEDRTMRKIITDYYDKCHGAEYLDLSLFDLPNIAAEALFQEHPLYDNCLAAAACPGCIAEADQLLRTVPNPHLLITGFGKYGQAVLEKALLSGMLSTCSQVKGHEKLRITIIDQDGEHCRDMVESRYPRINKLCSIEYIDFDIGSSQVEKRLSGLPSITYIAICFSSQTTCVCAMEKLRSYLSLSENSVNQVCGGMPVPIAVRMKNDGAVIRYLAGDGQIFSFGTLGRILNFEYVFKYSLENRAKDFNKAYMKVQALLSPASEAPGGRDSLWSALSYEKKDSSRAQALNQPYFQALIRCLKPLPPKEEVLICPENHKAFLTNLAAWPDLDALARLEHARWCAFCYCNGYVGRHPDPAEKGKEHRLEDGDVYFGKVHHCLIDGWEDMKQDPVAGKTIIYDVCSIYGYAGK